jgi:hypothetical protein
MKLYTYSATFFIRLVTGVLMHFGHGILPAAKCRLSVNSGLGTQKQARELILGPSPAGETRVLSFNRMQSSVVTCLLTDTTH